MDVPGGRRAAVIVSGGDAISPFTTPDRACRTGLAAGSTDTALRAALLDAGHEVYTSPANVGDDPVTVDRGFGGFSDPPEQLPASLTVNAIGPIDTAGSRLAAFLNHLGSEFDVSTVDLVGHSMGGLFARAAIAELLASGSSMRIRSLTTIGTPWQGSFPADYADGGISLAAARAHPSTAAIMVEFKTRVEAEAPGASTQVTRRFLTEPGGWNDRHAGVLDGIPVTLIGGDHFRSAGGSPDVWPHDGLVTISSALAAAVPRTVLPTSPALTFNDVHSLFFAHTFALPDHKALTWDPEVHRAVVTAISANAISD